jgi:hypothetical protein
MENQEQQAQQPQPELGIADLQNIRTILNVAVRRGVFGAAEISSVGAVFDRLNAFLNAVAPQTAEQQATETGEQIQEQPNA